MLIVFQWRETTFIYGKMFVNSNKLTLISYLGGLKSIAIFFKYISNGIIPPPWASSSRKPYLLGGTEREHAEIWWFSRGSSSIEPREQWFHAVLFHFYNVSFIIDFNVPMVVKYIFRPVSEICFTSISFIV